MSELYIQIAQQRSMLNGMRSHTDHWYFVSRRLAEMVREWRKANTLTGVDS